MEFSGIWQTSGGSILGKTEDNFICDSFLQCIMNNVVLILLILNNAQHLKVLNVAYKEL